MSQNPQTKIQGKAMRSGKQAVEVRLHQRSYRRAECRVKVMEKDAVHPAKIQHSLHGWSTWWYHVSGLSRQNLLREWVKITAMEEPGLVWYGHGLLLGTSPAHK